VFTSGNREDEEQQSILLAAFLPTSDEGKECGYVGGLLMNLWNRRNAKALLVVKTFGEEFGSLSVFGSS